MFNINFDVGVGLFNGSNAKKALEPIVTGHGDKRKETNYFFIFGVDMLNYIDSMPFLGIGGGMAYGTNTDNETNYWKIRNFSFDVKAVLRPPRKLIGFEPYIAGGIGIMNITIEPAAPAYTGDYKVASPYYLIEAGVKFVVEDVCVLGFLVRHRSASESKYLNGYKFAPTYTEISLGVGGAF
jgi:hypothetical protein